MIKDPKVTNILFKPFAAIGVFSFFSLMIPVTPLRLNFVTEAWTQTKTQAIEKTTSPKQREGKKTGGIVGDPSRKRGFDLGYDAGPRAGNEDKAQNKTPDHSLRPEYMKPEQFYRYEYGSRAMFIAGYRRGFLRGYNSSFVPHSRKAQIEGPRTREPPAKKNALAKESMIAGDAW